MSPTVSMAQLADPVRRRLYVVLAKRALGLETGSAVLDWAYEALADGWDSGPLAILAGLDKPPNEFEIDRYLAEALRSLNIEPLDRDGLVTAWGLGLAHDLVAGAISPRDGCRGLSNLWRTAGFPERYLPFYLADEQLGLADEGIYGTAEAVAEDILKTARHLVETAPH